MWDFAFMKKNKLSYSNLSSPFLSSTLSYPFASPPNLKTGRG
jgi:hypothetical protein